MSDEKFLLEYEKLLDKGYCDCNEMNCIDNDSPRRILRIAKGLQQENKGLKLQLKGTTHCYDEEEHKRLQEENQKLKEKIKKIVEYAYGTDMLVSEYKQLCKIAEVE